MKVCIIGSVGHVGQAFRELRDCPQAEFVGIAPGSEQEAADSLLWYDIPVFADYRTMLEEAQPEMAIISPIYGLTAAIATECARRGIHVFCEKPVAGTLEELEMLEAVAAQNKVRIGAMHYLRFSPNFYHAKKMIDQGCVGQVRLVNARKSYRFGNRPDWYRERKDYTGTILWVGIHAIDWIRFFTGKKFRSVTALHDGNPEMSALCQFALEDGVMASASIDFYRPQAAPTHGDDWVRIVGTEGVMEVLEEQISLINEDGEQIFCFADAPKLTLDFLLDRSELSTEEIMEVTKAALLARESADLRGKQYLIEERVENNEKNCVDLRIP